MHMKFDMKAVG